MKKIVLILTLILLTFQLTSCGDANPLVTEVPSPEEPTTLAEEPVVSAPKIFAPKEDKLLERICALYGLDKELYAAIKTNAFLSNPTVSELPDTVSFEQVELAKKLINFDPELFFIKNLELSADSTYIKITYSGESKENEKKAVDLANKIDYTISNSVKDSYTEFEKVLSVYGYLSRNIDAVSDENLKMYDLFVNGKGNSTTFSEAMQLLLNQADIESYVTNSVEGDFWVTAKINGNFYHFSPYLESKNTRGQGLGYFAKTDVEMKDFYSSWLICDGLIEEVCADETYIDVSTVGSYGVNFDKKEIYFIDKSSNNNIVKYSYLDGYRESVYGKRAQDMVYSDNFIYFADLDSRNKLCKLELSSGITTELVSFYVTRMYSKNDKIIYIDDISNTEGSLNIG